MKRSFFQAAVVLILLYGCTTYTLTKRLEEETRRQLHKNAASNIETSPGGNTPQGTQLYGHLSPITKPIQVRRTRHAGHCWRSRDELISNVLLWTPTYGWAKARDDLLEHTLPQVCEDTECSPEDLPEARNDREKWRESVRDICTSGRTWWWWWWWLPQKNVIDRVPIYRVFILDSFTQQ